MTYKTQANLSFGNYFDLKIERAEECGRGGGLRKQRTSEVRHKELGRAKAL